MGAALDDLATDREIDREQKRVTAARMTDWQPIETAPTGIDVMLYGSYLYPGDTSLTKYIYVGSVGKERRGATTCCETFNIEQFKLWAAMPEYPIDPDERTVSYVKGESTLPEAKPRRICDECGHICYGEFILNAVNPFEAAWGVEGCPHCKSADSFSNACMDEGCPLEASSGRPGVFGFRYVWTCWNHSPSNPSHKTPKIATQET